MSRDFYSRRARERFVDSIENIKKRYVYVASSCNGSCRQVVFTWSILRCDRKLDTIGRNADGIEDLDGNGDAARRAKKGKGLQSGL